MRPHVYVEYQKSLTWRKMKRIRARGKGTTHTHGKRKLWFEVHCEIHGRSSGANIPKMVKVTRPVGKHKMLYRGCPMCAGG